MGIAESNYVYLNPLEPSEELRSMGFWTFDVETRDGLKGKELECYSLAYLKNNREYGTIDGNQSLIPLFRKLHTWKDIHHAKVIYVHNLSFDIRFIIEYCINHDIIYKPIISGSNFISCILDGLNIQFIDSFQFLQEKQELAEQNWQIESEFTKAQTDNLMRELFRNTKYPDKIKPYRLWSKEEKRLLRLHCRNDTIALHKIMRKFRQMIFSISGADVLSVISIGSLAMKCMRTCLLEPIVNPFLYFSKSELGKVCYEIDKEKEAFVRNSYFGGRNECIDLKRRKECLYFDIVSMYPYNMKDKYYPVGYPSWYGKKKDEIQFLNDIINGKMDKLGFIECYVEFTEKVKTNYPVLQKRINNHVCWTNCSFFGTYTSIELQYARECGYKIVPIRGLIYPEKAKLFEKFVNKFIKIKNTSKGGKRKGAKIILNGSYGKFGQNFELKTLNLQYFVNEEQKDEFLALNPNSDEYICRYNEELGIYMAMKSEDSIVKHTYMNVGLASFITAYSRITLLKMVHTLEKQCNYRKVVLYMDTDSIVISNRYKKFMQNYLGKELGMWVIEQTFEEIQFKAPKAYISMQYQKLELDLISISVLEKFPLTPVNYFKLCGIHPKLKLKGVNSMKIQEIVNCERVCKAQDKIAKINELISNEIEMSEIYMKFKEAHRYGLVLGTKKPTKMYSFENLKRNFQNRFGTSQPWTNETLPAIHKKELEIENSERLNRIKTNI